MPRAGRASCKCYLIEFDSFVCLCSLVFIVDQLASLDYYS